MLARGFAEHLGRIDMADVWRSAGSEGLRHDDPFSGCLPPRH